MVNTSMSGGLPGFVLMGVKQCGLAFGGAPYRFTVIKAVGSSHMASTACAKQGTEPNSCIVTAITYDIYDL